MKGMCDGCYELKHTKRYDSYYEDVPDLYLGTFDLCKDCVRDCDEEVGEGS